MRYQETWINGPTSVNHQRKCSDRYEALKPVLDQFTRPFSVFDLGTNLGYFPFRIATDYDATCVMADTREDLESLCKENKNSIWLNHRFTIQDLKHFSASEYFDVVLALSVLHHFNDKCCEALDALLDLGKIVIVESAGRNDIGSLNYQTSDKLIDYIETLDSMKIAEHPSHTSGVLRPMYVINTESPKKLTRQTMDAHARGAPPIDVLIDSSKNHCNIRIDHLSAGVHTIEERKFIPGMNIWNFLQLGGSYPVNVEGMVKEEVVRLLNTDQWHDDLRPWNFILDKQKVHAIDVRSKWWRSEPETDGMDKCLDMMRKK